MLGRDMVQGHWESPCRLTGRWLPVMLVPKLVEFKCQRQGMFKYYFLHFEKMRYLTLTGDHMVRVHTSGEWCWRKAKTMRLGQIRCMAPVQ